jgi:hypothetical protein
MSSIPQLLDIATLNPDIGMKKTPKGSAWIASGGMSFA